MIITTTPAVLKWEQIEDSHGKGVSWRARVFGGWLVKTTDDVHIKMHEDMTHQTGYEWRTSMCFVPDPNYLWGKMNNDNIRSLKEIND